MSDMRVINNEGIAKPEMLISAEYYTQLIEQNGYLKGRNKELEKQLNKKSKINCLKEPDVIRYFDNKPYNLIKLTMNNLLKREIRRLEGLKKDSCREELLRINGKIEGLKYAIDKLFEYKIEGGNTNV